MGSRSTRNSAMSKAPWGCPLEPDTPLPDNALGQGAPVSGKSKYPSSSQGRRHVARSSDRSLRQGACELGVTHDPLRNWVRTAEQAQSCTATSLKLTFATRIRLMCLSHFFLSTLKLLRQVTSLIRSCLNSDA